MPKDWPFQNIPRESTAGTIIQALEKTSVPPLVPKSARDKGIQSQLDRLTVEDLFGNAAIRNHSFAHAVKSGLYLWNDCLDESHKISQTIENPTGSYWHGIMHRREPDYGNSKYWFRRVGRHEAFPSVLEAARAAAGSSLPLDKEWEPFRFVDLCEEAAEGKDRQLVETLEAVQLAEIRVLLDYSYGKAIK